MPTAAQLLDLEGVSQRSSDVRFDVLDTDLTVVGQITPTIGSARVTLNTSRKINRTLDGLELAPSVQAQLDPFGHRLRPVWVLQDGSTYPLGVFILGSMDRTRMEWGLEADVPAVDQTLMLDTDLSRTVGFPAGALVREAIEQRLAAVGVPQYEVDPDIDTQVANPISWPAGDATELQVVNDLAAMAGAYSLYFDNAGVGQVRRVPDLSATTPQHVYAGGGRILTGSMVETDDLMDAANRYVVIDSGSPWGPIVGVYDIPDDAPHSIANRGFAVTRTIPEQGLASQAEAIARAQAAYAQDRGTYEWVQFASPPDPRHDTFDVVSYLGVVYREVGWELPLIEGSEMTHDLRRVWGADGAAQLPPVIAPPVVIPDVPGAGSSGYSDIYDDVYA